MSSKISGLKKNLHLKHMIFTSPLTKRKITIPNIISDTKRISTQTNTQTNSTNTSNYLNSHNQLLTNLYHNYTTSRKINSAQTSNKKCNSVNKKISQNLFSLGSSPLITNYSIFASNLNSKRDFSNSLNNSIKNYSKKNYSGEKNLKKRNLNDLFTSYNCSFSSNLNNKKKFNESSIKKNKIKSLISKQLSKKNKKRNIIPSYNNTSYENVSTFKFNINIYYNDFFKKINHKLGNNNKNIKNNSMRKNNNLKNEKSIQQTKISTTQSTLNKKKTKSVNSNISNNNETNEIINFKNIESPEELHFYFVYIAQNKKNIEKKFENNYDN